MEGKRGATQERRSAAHIEGRASARSAGSSAHADDGTTVSLDEEAAKSEESERGPEADEGAECSASAQSSRSRLVVSSQSSTGVTSTVASSSLCDSQDVTSVTSLRASRSRGQRLSPTSYAERRRRALRIFWNMHKKTLLMVLMVVSIISLITATTVNRRPAARAHIAAAKPSEKDGSFVMDAPAVPTVHFTKFKSAVVSPGAQAVSTPAHDEDGDDGAPAPVPTSVQTEPTGDMSDAAGKVEDANEGASQSESEALESSRTIRRQHRRLPGASTSTRRRLHEPSTAQSDDEDDSSFGSRGDAPYVPDDVRHDPFGSLTNDRCGSVRYTFCPRLRREVFYDRQSGQCVAITTAAEHEAEKEVASRAAARYQHTGVDNDAAPLCNSSPNRFSSLESCRQSCQRSELPAARCFEKTIFSECRKEHVVSTRWYFDGRRCREWHFPAGRCPSAHAFRSRAQCARACVVSATGPQKKSPQDGRCGEAQSRPCNERQLRFLYFADVASADGHVRCLKASQTTLVGRRCLVGPNRFDSIATCRAACVRSGDEGAGQR